jgi:hypothetical protein
MKEKTFSYRKERYQSQHFDFSFSSNVFPTVQPRLRYLAYLLYHVSMKRWFALLVLFFLIVSSVNATAESDKERLEISVARDALLQSLHRPGIVLSHRMTTRHLGQFIHHFDAIYQDLPIFFEDASVQTDGDGDIRRLSRLTSFLPETSSLHPEPSRETVSGWAASKGYLPSDVIGHGWLADTSGKLIPVVRVDTEGSVPEAYLSLYLDAFTGRVVETDLLMQTGVYSLFDQIPISDTLGSVYYENPITTPDIVQERLTYLDDNTTCLYGRYVHAESCIDKDTCKESAPMADQDKVSTDDFLFEPLFFDDPDASDPFAEVNAYRNITRISAWIHEQFGWNRLFNEETWITVRVGRSWDNAAYYSGSKKTAPYIVFGHDDVNYAYDSDTAYHEFGHAINDLFWNHSWMSKDGYGLDISMFTIEEAIADMWSATFSGDPVLNAYITVSRNVDNNATCPNSMYGEGHYDSRFVSAFLWDVREEIGSDPFNNIFYRSLSFLTKSTSFSDFIDALAHSVQDLVEEGVAGVFDWHVDLIQEKARVRGLLDDACLNRFVPLNTDRTRYAIGYGRSRTGNNNYPFGLQWEITAHESRQRFHIQLEWIFPESTDEGEEVSPGYRVHVRKNRPVEVVWRDKDVLEDGDDAFEVLADYTWDNSPEMVEYPIIGGVDLKQGEKIFLLISADSEEHTIVIGADLVLRLESVATPPSDPSLSVDNNAISKRSSHDGTLSCSFRPLSSTASRCGNTFLFDTISSVFRD